MSELVKAIDKLRLITLVQNYEHSQHQIKAYTDKLKESFNLINEEYKPEVEIGKKYLCIEHPNELMAYAQFSPDFYANKLSENKLCLYFKHDGFKDKECTVIRVELDHINTHDNILFWLITVENDAKQLFQCRYATSYNFEKCRDITVDDLGLILMNISKTPKDIDISKVLLAVDYRGSFASYINKVPMDWVYTGRPHIPKDVNTWAEFITHPDSMMEAPNSQLLTINEWLNYCNRQKVSVV